MKRLTKKKIEVFDRKIPLRNYFLVLTVSILVIILTLYVRTFYLSYKSYSEGNSYFNYRKVNEITKDDFDFILSEAADNILYVNYGSKKTYSLERKLYRALEKNDLIDKVIYWNIKDYVKNDKYMEILQNRFTNITTYEAPLLIIINNGEAKRAIKVTDELVKDKNLKEIIEGN